MALSKKDYIAIAAIIADEQERVLPQDHNPESQAAHRALEAKRFLIASRLADYFGAQRSEFDRERFLTACRVK